MFDTLVESSGKKSGGRTGLFFLVTTLIYMVVLTALGVVTIFYFNPGLVDALNSLFCAGQLMPAAKTQIVNYANTLSYTTPTLTQMRDRVRAVVHLIVSSPDFTIQR